MFEYRQRFSNVLHGVGKDRKANRFVLNLAIAFIPAAVMGLLFDKQIKEYLFNPLSVAVMLVLGGFLFCGWRNAKAEQSLKLPMLMHCVRLMR
ncbi:undecaprenyl pyrophosphate phosphatase [Neisseria gonorrhoeae]|uniref:Undecaprenyl-diphosphatase n=1 Tax=Neisseria gonorrhoeae TaxID=485 RepID=A0A378VSU3_NEIGO|nr:undecaprenyl pyrophosphate phosphatase [Neisseria gonorrhoeae]